MAKKPMPSSKSIGKEPAFPKVEPPPKPETKPLPEGAYRAMQKGTPRVYRPPVIPSDETAGVTKKK